MLAISLKTIKTILKVEIGTIKLSKLSVLEEISTLKIGFSFTMVLI